MAATKKMQLEIEKALKKVQEGIEEFQVTWDKMQEAHEVLYASQACHVFLLAPTQQRAAWRTHASSTCLKEPKRQPACLDS